MEFTLYYQGKLRANGTAEEKHTIRQYFHCQLRELWNQEPLSTWQHVLNPNFDDSIIKEVGPFQFAPLVSSRLGCLADLEITMLRPGPPGIISHGGDIDNRLKTLLDALKVPEQSALPKRATPAGGDEQPFFCLVEDDRLITGVSIKTDRLLDPSAPSGEVMLLLHVKTKSNSAGWLTFPV